MSLPSDRDSEPRGAVGLPRISHLLGLDRDELGRTVLLSALLFVASTVFVMGRTARDALLLSAYPFEWIAYLGVVYGVGSSLVAIVFDWVSSRLSRREGSIVLAFVGVVTFLAARLAIERGVDGAIPVFYVLAEVVGNLFVVQAWMIANDLHNTRSARRLFGYVGAGRVVGIVVSGFAVARIVRHIGTVNLVCVIAGLMLVFASLVVWIHRRYGLPTPAKQAQQTQHSLRGESESWAASAGRVQGRHRGYMALLAAMVLVANFALTIGDYQFKSIAKLAYPDREQLASYLGMVHGLIGIVALVFQVVLTPRILKYLGVVPGLLAMPVAFLASTAWLIVSPTLPVVTVLKLSDNGLQFTIHDATMQLLYFAFPPSLRTRLRALLEAAIKPLGYGLAGGMLALLSAFVLTMDDPAELAKAIGKIGYISLGLGVVWVALVPLVRRAYVDVLRSSLVRRQSVVGELPGGAMDMATRRVLIETLKAGAPAQVVFAFECLATSVPQRARTELPTLLRHNSATVRAFALQQAAWLDSSRAMDLARASLSDASLEVRRAAIVTLGAVGQEEAVEEIEPYADDPDHQELRDAALVTMIAKGGLTGVLAGGQRVQQMLQSPREELRAEGASVLGKVGRPGLARTLKPLLRDSSLLVRRAAAIAASGCVHHSLVEPMIEALRERALSKPLTQALVAAGPMAVPSLAKHLKAEDTPRWVRLCIPRILHGIGGSESLEILRSCFDTPDEGVRQKCLASASRLREELRAPSLPAARVRALIEQEMAGHVKLRDGYLEARRWLARPLLDQQIRRELRGHLVRILRLCEQVYPRAHVAAARAGVFSSDPTKRANALEVLDNVLDRDNRLAILELVATFVSQCSFREPLALATEPLSVATKTWFDTRVKLPGYYRRAVLFEAVAYYQAQELAWAAKDFVDDDEPFLRENALMVVASCQPEGWLEMLELAQSDSHAVVRAYAKYVRSSRHSGLQPEDDMYTTVEKILFLQGVALFSGVPGNELAPLALRSNVIRLAPGEVLFREHEDGDSLYVVFHGKIALTKAGQELAVLGQGQVAGELAMLDKAPRMVTALAVGEADVLKVSGEDFRAVLQDTAEFANRVISVLVKRLRDLMGPSDRFGASGFEASGFGALGSPMEAGGIEENGD